jgi:hypothetical protein
MTLQLLIGGSLTDWHTYLAAACSFATGATFLEPRITAYLDRRDARRKEAA